MVVVTGGGDEAEDEIGLETQLIQQKQYRANKSLLDTYGPHYSDDYNLELMMMLKKKEMKQQLCEKHPKRE